MMSSVNCSFYLFTTECWSFYFFKSWEEIILSNYNVKGSKSAAYYGKAALQHRRGYNRCWIKKKLKCVHGHGCPSNWKTLHPIYQKIEVICHFVAINNISIYQINSLMLQTLWQGNIVWTNGVTLKHETEKIKWQINVDLEMSNLLNFILPAYLKKTRIL